MYIWEEPGWPNLTWRPEALVAKLAGVRHAQGRLIGRMEGLGFRLQQEAELHTLTQDVLKSSEIEGERLDAAQVRSSVARRLGIDIAGLVPADRDVEGVVAMMLDATQNFERPLTPARLFGWQASLFPTGRSGLIAIKVGAWRDDAEGPMQIVSGPFGRERVHFQAPPADRVPSEMTAFLAWFNGTTERDIGLDPVLKAGIAHFRFVTVHPFADGNGRIARAIADMALARAEGSAQRFYSMSSRIRQERDAYYKILERTQASDEREGATDITAWLDWFLDCMARALADAETTLAEIMRKAKFWERFAQAGFNARQIKVLNRMLDGFDGKMTSSKWAKLAKCSQDTASRDIQDLVEKGALKKGAAGGRSTSYEVG
jgi:Fic family protein